MKILYQIIAILFGAAVLAGLQGFVVGTQGSAYESSQSGLDVQTALELNQAIWIDARPEDAFLENHHPFALNITEDNWFEGVDLLLEQWDPGQSIIVYCDGGGCASSRHLAERIRSELGLEPVFWLRGGWQSLQSSKGRMQ